MTRTAILLTAATLLLVVPVSGQQVTTITAEFTGAGDLAVGPGGNVYVADFGNTLGGGTTQFVPGTEVYRVTPAGETTVFATGLQGASGNAFGPDGFLYQSNIAGGRISKIAPDGTVTTLSSSNLISGPVGIAVDADLNVYNTNCTTNTITVTTPQGVTSVFAQHVRLQCPNGLAIDPEGNLYASNFNNCDVLKIDADGNVTVFACVNAFHPARSTRGNGHITYSNGRLYVCAWQGNRIYEISLEGDVALVAGSGASGRDDGPAATATFNQPNGIDGSVSGDTLYVNDTVQITQQGRLLHPNVVRMITGLNPAATTNTGEIPQDHGVALRSVFPNPVTTQANIVFALDDATDVRLDVYDAFGRHVRSVLNTRRGPGEHKILLDAQNLPSGIYAIKLVADTEERHATIAVTH